MNGQIKFKQNSILQEIGCYKTVECMQDNSKIGSHKNIWHGLGRQRIEIPKPVLKARVQNNEWLRQLYICSLGYYPKAEKHYTYRKKGLPENFLFYCVDGKGWYKIGERKYQVSTNEFFMLPQNVEHAYGSDDEHPWSIYWIHFGGESLPELNKMPVVQKFFKPTLIKNGGDIAAQFSKIYKTLELGYSTDNLMYANMCLSYFISLFIHNEKHYTVNASATNDCIDSAILFMQEHIHENLTLEQLSKQYSYSPSRFSSLFRQKTGYAPIDYFIHMKMQKASQHLDFSNRSVKDIAMSMGFDDPYYFSKRFKKITGMSPKKYRSMKKD